MGKSIRYAILTLLVILLLLLTGCGTGGQENSNQGLAQVSTTTSHLATPGKEQSQTPTFTLSPTASPTPAPTSTATPTQTPSPTPEPVQIAADNVDRLRLVDEIGEKSRVGQIYDISVSTDGKQALIFGDTVVIYSLESGKQVFIEGEFYQASLSPDGNRFALASPDQNIKVIALEGDQHPTQLQGEYTYVEALAWSPDGGRIAGYDPASGLMVWDASSGELLNSLAFEAEENLWFDLVQLKWSPDSQMVGIAGVDEYVRIASGDELITLTGFNRPVTHLDWSPDGSRLAGSSAHSPDVIIWRTANWNRVLSITNHIYWVSNVSWSPDGKYLATGDAAGTAFIRNPNSGSIIDYFPNQNSPNLVSWSPDGDYLLAEFDNELKIYDVGTQKPVETPDAVLGGVGLFSWIPGSKRLLLANVDERVQLWDIVTGEVWLLIDPELGNIVALDWAPDGKRLALGERGGGVLIYDHANRNLTKVANKAYPFITSLSWSPDGKALAVANDEQIAIIDVVTGAEQLSFEDGSWRYYQDWAHPGDFILTGNWKGMISLWDPHSGKLIDRWNSLRDAIRGVSFSADYEMAIILANQSITLWDVAEGKQIAARQFGMDSFMDTAQWSPDGAEIALIIAEFQDLTEPPAKSLCLLDVDTLEDRQVIDLGLKTFVLASSSEIAWSPDGSMLALSSGEVRGGQSGEVMHRMPAGGKVTWSPDGYSLVIINDNLEIWQVVPVAP